MNIWSMLDIASLRAAFAEKLKRTGSMDAAFTKAVWLAFKAGIEAGKQQEYQTQQKQKRAERYLMVSDHPYYPNVDYCESLEQAKAAAVLAAASMSREHGEHECKISVAIMHSTVTVRSDY